jgi:hypothetical protein
MLSSRINDFVHTVTNKPLPKGWLKAVDLGCAGRLPETGEIKGSRGTPLYMVRVDFSVLIRCFEWMGLETRWFCVVD